MAEESTLRVEQSDCVCAPGTSTGVKPVHLVARENIEVWGACETGGRRPYEFGCNHRLLAKGESVHAWHNQCYAQVSAKVVTMLRQSHGGLPFFHAGPASLLHIPYTRNASEYPVLPRVSHMRNCLHVPTCKFREFPVVSRGDVDSRHVSICSSGIFLPALPLACAP